MQEISFENNNEREMRLFLEGLYVRLETLRDRKEEGLFWDEHGI